MAQDVFNISVPAFGIGYLVGATFASIVWILDRRRTKK